MENKKKQQVKEVTPLEALKMKPKAMQVGPQLDLRKSWGKDEVKHLKGGNNV